MLLSLGLFVFSINTLSYQSLQRTTQWRQNSQQRIGERPSYQYLGPGKDELAISGWIAPEIAGSERSLQNLRDMADTGAPYLLVDGSGKLHGLWVIKKISDNRTHFYPNGEARRIEFSIHLELTDDSQIEQLTLITDALSILA